MKPILEFFGIRPDYELDLMKPGQSLAELSAGVLIGLEMYFKDRNIDGLIVQGDTTSCMAASTWGFLKRIPVFHIEAGLRTGDRTSPFPEEFNRCVTALASTLHFAPTLRSAFNLFQEGYTRESVHVVGNTVIDALLEVSNRLDQDRVLDQQMRVLFPMVDESKKLLLATVHRRESFGFGLREVFRALRQLAEDKGIQIVLPLHMNPSVREAAAEVLQDSRVHVIAPLSYVPFIWLMKRSTLILSDSGGVQEEAPSLGKPVLVLRETTERPESIEAGNCKLVGTSKEVILKATKQLLEDPVAYRKMQEVKNPYGNGKSSQKISHILAEYFGINVTVPYERETTSLGGFVG